MLNEYKSITQGLYDLAVHPEYVDELRKEVEDVVAEHGWTKDAVQKMHKIDSFLKESQRLNGSAKCKSVVSNRRCRCSSSKNSGCSPENAC